MMVATIFHTKYENQSLFFAVKGILFLVALFRSAICFADLSVAQVEEMRSLVSKTDNQIRELEGEGANVASIVGRICKEAAHHRAFPVLRAALNNPELTTHMTALNAIFEVGDFKRSGRWEEPDRLEIQSVLESAFLNPTIWPDPQLAEYNRDGNTNAAWGMFQMLFGKAIKEACGVDVQKGRVLWSRDDRENIAIGLGWVKPTGNHSDPESPKISDLRSKEDTQIRKSEKATPKSGSQLGRAEHLPKVAWVWLAIAILITGVAVWVFPKRQR